MSFDFKENDLGLNTLMRELRKAAARGQYVKVGMVGPDAQAAHGNGVTNLDVALFNEYGTRNIPARPFISASFDKNRQKYERELQKGLEKVYEGNLEMKDLLGRLGAQAAADVKNYVTQGDQVPPPNAPSTLAAKQAKGSGDPRTLVDTGRMIGAVTWEMGEK